MDSVTTSQPPYQSHSFACYWVLAVPERIEVTPGKQSVTMCSGMHPKHTGFGFQPFGTEPRSEGGNYDPNNERNPLFWILGFFTVMSRDGMAGLHSVSCALRLPSGPQRCLKGFFPQNHRSESVTFTYSRQRWSREAWACSEVCNLGQSLNTSLTHFFPHL